MSSLDNTVSLLHGSYAVWNAIQCVPLLTSTELPDGYSLTYFPFAVGTHLSLALAAPPSFRRLHSMVSLVVYTPLLKPGNDAMGAKYHAAATIAYLMGRHLEDNQTQTPKQTQQFATTEPKPTPIPLAGRVLAGVLGVSQLGISCYFTLHYFLGNPSSYEPFIRHLLVTQDKIPLVRLTSEFLRGVYLAGTYTVTPIGWCHATLLTQAVVQNSRRDCYTILKSIGIQLRCRPKSYCTRLPGSRVEEATIWRDTCIRMVPPVCPHLESSVPHCTSVGLLRSSTMTRPSRNDQVIEIFIICYNIYILPS